MTRFEDEQKLLRKFLRVTMPDGSEWDVPVEIIARSRATYYAKVDEVSFATSLREDTLPQFADCEYEIFDWAANNMNWEDVKANARMVSLPPVCDFQEGWVNGPKEIVGADE